MPTVTHIESEAKFRKRFGDMKPWHGSGWYDRDTGDKDNRPPKPIGVPYIISDIPAHVHAGQYIGGRAAQRELEKTHGVVPYERIGALQTAPKGVYDPNCDKWKQWESDITKGIAKKAGLDAASSQFEKRMSGELAEHKKQVLSGKKRKKA